MPHRVTHAHIRHACVLMSPRSLMTRPSLACVLLSYLSDASDKCNRPLRALSHTHSPLYVHVIIQESSESRNRTPISGGDRGPVGGRPPTKPFFLPPLAGSLSDCYSAVCSVTSALVTGLGASPSCARTAHAPTTALSASASSPATWPMSSGGQRSERASASAGEPLCYALRMDDHHSTAAVRPWPSGSGTGLWLLSRGFESRWSPHSG